MAKKTATKIETEVKFTVPDRETFEALRELTALGGFQLNPTGTRVVTDQYLDTAGQRFLKAGYACRIRAAKQKLMLTLKTLTPPEGNVHRRKEVEQVIEAEQPEAWAEGEAKLLVQEIAGESPLEVLFIVHQTRYKYHGLLNQQPVLEFSLDAVSHGDAGTVDYLELEAELIESGTEEDLARFVDALQARWSLPAESRSKFERGVSFRG